MAKTVAIDIDIHARDLRFLRAADTVLKKYDHDSHPLATTKATPR